MKYLKNPLEVEAFQWSPGCELPAWAAGKVIEYTGIVEPFASVGTLEGTMRAMPGDYIIQGVEGEVYPCKSSIFEKTYRPVNPETALERESTPQ